MIALTGESLLNLLEGVALSLAPFFINPKPPATTFYGLMARN